jgi:hypothetical protein
VSNLVKTGDRPDSKLLDNNFTQFQNIRANLNTSQSQRNVMKKKELHRMYNQKMGGKRKVSKTRPMSKQLSSGFNKMNILSVPSTTNLKVGRALAMKTKHNSNLM